MNLRMRTLFVFLLVNPALALVSKNDVIPMGNQTDSIQPFILQTWKNRVIANGGVHSWSNENDGMRVFQEWIAMMTLAQSGTVEDRRRVGLELEKYVVQKDIQALGFIGTSLPFPGYTNGDFDMALLGCSSLIGLFLNDRLVLTDKTLDHLIRKVIRVWGQTPKDNFDVLFVSVPETENHLFMIESTRFLTNQILFENPRHLQGLQALRDSLLTAGVVIDNNQGMLKRLLLRVMNQAMCKGLFEFNAQIYQRFTIHALDNLYSFSHDPSIQDGAACLLDYISTLFAFQSYGSIRVGPFRRSSEAYQDTTLLQNDAACSFYAIQSGSFAWNREPLHGFWSHSTSHASMALYSSVLKYRIPDPILNFIQTRHGEYRAEIHSAYVSKEGLTHPTEIYYGGPNYLLTAGGRYETYAGPNFPTYKYWFSDAPWVYDVITRSSSLLLEPVREKPRSWADLLHFKGPQWRANNLSLYRNFIYGYTAVDSHNSPLWPQHIPVQWIDATRKPLTCQTQDFQFQFIDRSKFGVYLVLSKLRPSKTFLRWEYQKYLRGTVEVVDTAKIKSILLLKDSILALNSPKKSWPSWFHRYVYVTLNGDRIHLNSRYDENKTGILTVESATTNMVSESPEILLPFPFPWAGDTLPDIHPMAIPVASKQSLAFVHPLFQVEFFTPWRGKAAISDGRGNMYVFNPSSGGYVLLNFQEWWNPKRILGRENFPVSALSTGVHDGI